MSAGAGGDRPAFGERAMRPGALLKGRYELEELVGTGATSNVFRAHDRELDRTVAVKVLLPELALDGEQVARFRREARSAAGLSHESIVSVIDQGADGGTTFTVLEYVDGPALEQLVERVGPLPLERALAIGTEVARALSIAHAHGYVHRDVKLQNVLVDRQGRAKVTGFMPELAPAEAAALAGTASGPAVPVDPGQERRRALDVQGDVSSLGALVSGLLTGEGPGAGERPVPAAVGHADRAADRPRSAGLPPRVEAALARALAQSSGRRFASMAEFGRELEACRAELLAGSAATTGVIPRPVRPSGGRRRWAARIAGALVLLGAVVAGSVLALPGLWHGGGRGAVTHSTAPAAKAAAAPARAAPVAPAPVGVQLRSVAAYDPPPGDGVEDNQRLPLATDGDPSTAWSTEWYATARFGGLKDGVGIVFDAGRSVRLTSLTVRSDTPGFTAVVKEGPTRSGPFEPVSRPQTVGRTTSFALHLPRAGRFYLLWITRLAPGTAPHYRADVNSVTSQASASAAT